MNYTKFLDIDDVLNQLTEYKMAMGLRWDDIESWSASIWANIWPVTDIEERLKLADYLITCPTDSVAFYEGRQAWWQKYCRGVPMIIMEAKWLCSGPRRLLIDDNAQNCLFWRAHGGEAIQHHGHWPTTLDKFNRMVGNG